MIHSMTGYGGAQCVEDGVSYALEIRSVNNRYLKLSFKLNEHLQFAEPTIEKLLRDRIRRGSVMCSLRTRASGEALASSVNTEALQRYVDRLGTVRVPGGVQPCIDLAVVASLPGVCESSVPQEQDRSRLLSIVESLTREALDRLIEMRRVEGEAVGRDLVGGCEAIRSRLTRVAERAPSVIDEYHARLEARVSLLMQKGGFELEADGLMREVALYAERSDISEELARLDSHLEQFAELCDRGDQVGRTLDFLTQELLREANTIASKSADARIAQAIVEIKGWIDRLKEQAANVE